MNKILLNLMAMVIPWVVVITYALDSGHYVVAFFAGVNIVNAIAIALLDVFDLQDITENETLKR